MTETEKKKLPILKYVIIAAAVAAAYFINVEVQTHFGEKALAATGLELRSLDEALVTAKAENKLVLADLSAIWCPTCRNIDNYVFSDDAVKALIHEKYVFARIEFETPEGEAFSERYNTRSFPTLLVLDANGLKLKELPVTTDPIFFASQL